MNIIFWLKYIIYKILKPIALWSGMEERSSYFRGNQEGTTKEYNRLREIILDEQKLKQLKLLWIKQKEFFVQTEKTLMFGKKDNKTK